MKVTKKALKPYWDGLQLLISVHEAEVEKLEQEMNKKFNKKDLTFFWCDGYCGIGNLDRSMKLVQFEEE